MSDTDDAPIGDFYSEQTVYHESNPAITEVLAELGIGQPEPVDVVAAEPDADPVVSSGETPPAVVVPPVPEEDIRGTLRLLEQENTLRKERDAFRAEREAFQAEVTKFKAGGDRMSLEDIRRAIERDPLKFFEEKVGIAPEQVSRKIIARKLGDKAPAELREEANRYEVEERFADLERQIRERDYALERERVRNGTRDFLGKQDTGSSKYPTLSAVATVDKDRVTEAIFAEIARDAGERGKTDPNAALLSYEEAAQRVEDQWAVYRKALAPSTNAPATPANVPPVAPAVKATPPVKRPAPPRRYWQEESSDEVEAALAEATAMLRNPAR